MEDEPMTFVDKVALVVLLSISATISLLSVAWAFGVFP